MKFSSLALIATMFPVGHAILNSTLQEDVPDVPDFSDSPISVVVVCDGNIDWSKLSLAELTLAGKALDDSYNAIHALKDNDDSQLNDLVFYGSNKRRMLQEEESETDNLGFPFWKRRPMKGLWTGMWGCSLCPADDNPDVTGPALKAWQSQFVAALLESGHTIFQSVRSCSIDLNPGVDVVPINTSPNADIDINCGKKINLGALPVSQGTFLAHALQASYNKVHASNANDDSELSDVYYYQKVSKKTMLSSEEKDNFVGEYKSNYNPKVKFGPGNPWVGMHTKGTAAPGLSGWWGCRLCPSDDDVMLGGSMNNTKAMKRHAQKLYTASSGAILKAWEAELNVLLQGGPFNSFKKVDWCSIQLLPHKPIVLDFDMEDEADIDGAGCGVRGGCKDGDVSIE